MLPTFHTFAPFLSPDECKSLINEYERLKTTPACTQHPVMKRWSLEVDINGSARWIRGLLKAAVEEVFRRPLVDHGCSFSVYPTGAPGQKLHRDDGRVAPGTEEDYDLRCFGARVVGATLYLNEDFGGGELKYYQGPTIKPVTGLLVVHNGEAVHGVNPVTAGTRYTIGAFYVAHERIT
jgi:hypothetical protein